MDTHARRSLAAWIGALALALAGAILVFWWRHSDGGPGDIGLAVVTLLAAALQCIPAAGLLANLWTSAALARIPLVLFGVVVALVSLLFLAVPFFAGVAAAVVATRALLGGGRRAYAMWLISSVPCLALGAAAAAFSWSLR